jgi:hypothetical protein
VIIPVHADQCEAQHVNQQPWDQCLQRLGGVADWGPEFEHHDGDDHREHPVAEGFQACGAQLAG